MPMSFDIVISLSGLNTRKSLEMRADIYKNTHFYNKNIIFIMKTLKT